MSEVELYGEYLYFRNWKPDLKQVAQSHEHGNSHIPQRISLFSVPNAQGLLHTVLRLKVLGLGKKGKNFNDLNTERPDFKNWL